LAKTTPVIGWILGLSISLVVFFTVGVTVLFAVTYPAMHSNGGTGVLVFLLVSWVAVPAACCWLAWAIKRALTRDR
jgi:hypothetical protein